MRPPIDEVKSAWTLLLPNAPVPEDRQFTLWMILNGEQVTVKGIAAAAGKYATRPSMTLDHLARFASSVMARQMRESRAKVGV
jgi:hypothetical protein